MKVTFSWFVIHTELRCTVNHISGLCWFLLLILQYNRLNHLKNKVESLNSLKQEQSSDIYIYMYFWNGIGKVFFVHPLFSLCAVVYSVKQTYSVRVT